VPERVERSAGVDQRNAQVLNVAHATVQARGGRVQREALHEIRMPRRQSHRDHAAE